jgi:uncharacterized protein involved in type VI secretion and phage assembly
MDAQVNSNTSGKGQESTATLRITTRLGIQLDDESKSPFLLTSVQGVEGISMPYSFDLTIFRSLTLPDLDPSTMINTPASIGMCGKTGDHPIVGQVRDPIWTYRNGIITSFQKFSTSQSVWERDGKIWESDAKGNFHVYKVKLVPCFSLLANETVWRIYEDKTVVEIVKDVFKSFSPTIPNDYVGTLPPNWPIIPYCVQFGETSFDFVTRLLDQFDIWYYFGHSYGEVPGAQEKMILGCNPKRFNATNIDEMSVVTGNPGIKEIASFQRVFTPAHLNVWAKGFDIMDPTGMVTTRGDTEVGRGYNLLLREHAPPYQREIFPADLVRPDGVSEPDAITHPTPDAIVQQTSDQKMEDEEVNVYTVQGSTKNPTLVAGCTVTIAIDKTADNGTPVGMPENRQFLLTRVAIAAFENTYGHGFWGDLQYVLSSPVRWVWSLFRDDARDQGVYIDPMSAMASSYLAGIAPPAGSSTQGGQQFEATLMQGLVQSFFSGVQGTHVRHMDKYANAFTAVPYDGARWKEIPSPDGTKPRAYGPHLAVVIGRYGTRFDDGSEQAVHISTSEVYADALGRVRVRFPWQATGPNQAIEYVDELLESDKCTAWVPVCEEWAGRGFGTQFLPRIGQQVLVHFLDGDPERPIITGRVYSTKGANTNLPFMPRTSRDLKKLSDLPNTVNERLPLSGIRTRSTPPQVDKYGNVTGKARFHLLRFDDTINKEQYLLRSQGRLDISASNHRYESIDCDRNLIVGGKCDDPRSIGGDYVAKVYEHYHLHVGDPDFPTQSGNRVTRIEQNDELLVKKSYQLDAGTYSAASGNYYLHVSGRPGGGGGKRDTIVDANDSLQVQGDLNQMIAGEWKTALAKQMSVRSDTTVVLEALSNISLVVGGSSIVLTPSGIYLTAPEIVANQMVMMVSGGAGPPPATPNAPPSVPQNDPNVPPPNEPVPADRGDSLAPPKWQK